MNGSVNVKTITYGRKRPIEPHGNAEFILTAQVGPEQTVEDVMESLRKIVARQFAELLNEEGECK